MNSSDELHAPKQMKNLISLMAHRGSAESMGKQMIQKLSEHGPVLRHKATPN